MIRSPIDALGALLATVETPLDVRLGQHIDTAISSGSVLLAILIAFAAGVVVSLSPCVYPLIPITIAIFGGREQTSYRRGFLLSLCYVAGMALFYSTAAVVFSLLGLASGSLMAIPAVVLTIAGLGLVMSLALVGVFELVLPASWITRLSAIGGAGYWGAFRMGLVAGIIAAPCAGPVLIFILALIAKQGQILLGVALMVAYALGIGLLFLVLGTFSQLIARLPKSGPWMEAVRGALGYGMLLVSIYLALPHLDFLDPLATLASRPLLLAGALGATAAGIALGALHLSFHDGVRSHLVRKIAGMALAGAGALMLVETLATAPAAAVQLAWRTDHDAALAEARAGGQPVMIDFGAEWCVACKELEHKTFTAPEFAAAAQRFALVRVDCTELDEQVSALWERYGIRGLPQIVFIDSRGAALDDPRVTTFLPAQQFVAEMSKVR
ncbi:MAG: thioredoxin family protein [Deltaproteobacteria bacterium]|nr:thioredoxin family protein [Deltaproteobacteria bacterium]